MKAEERKLIIADAMARREDIDLHWTPSHGSFCLRLRKNNVLSPACEQCADRARDRGLVPA